MSKDKVLEALHDKRNSLLYWYPKIKDIAPTPKTEWIPYKFDISWFERGVSDEVVEKVKEIARRFGYPVFIRTDEASNKWSYKNSCYVESEDKVKEHINNLIEFTVMSDLSIKAIVVREFIELDWRFKAFWGELPIAPEVRVMIRDGEVEEWFFYWPFDAIRNPSVEWCDAAKYLLEMREIADAEQHEFLSIARKVAREFEGYWSIDFARKRGGGWILIDMALGDASWKPGMKGR